jgi:hypothetical protein
MDIICSLLYAFHPDIYKIVNDNAHNKYISVLLQLLSQVIYVGFHQNQSNSENSKIAFSYLVLSLSSSERSIQRLRNRPSQVPSSPSHCLDMGVISFSKLFGNRSPLGKSSVSQAESVLTFINRVIRQVSRRQCTAVSVFHLVGSFRSVGGNNVLTTHQISLHKKTRCRVMSEFNHFCVQSKDSYIREENKFEYEN